MKPEVKRCLAEMGVTQQVLGRVNSAKLPREGELALEDAKAVCKQGFRRIALELHPDVNGGDDEKTRRFGRYKSIYESFQGSKYKHRQKQKQGFPRPPVSRSRANFDDMQHSSWGGFVETFRQSQQDMMHRELEELLKKLRANERDVSRKRRKGILVLLAGYRGKWLKHLSKTTVVSSVKRIRYEMDIRRHKVRTGS